MPDTLTTAEQSEFSLLNLVAYTLAREEAAKTNTHIPCWLCLSQEAKNEYRQAFIAKVHAIMFMDVATLEQRIETMPGIRVAQKKWIETELEFKRLREEEHNPNAYFS